MAGSARRVHLGGGSSTRRDCQLAGPFSETSDIG